ncbi:MAG: MFS transporter [Bacteroides sp.]|jgi:GPH family glycoside/pentoside/hexuronide:cation symporter|nr:MFS transporter [Bacteroides sp.]
MEQAESVAATNNNSTDRVSFAQMAAYGSGGIIPIALFNVAGILVGLMGNISLGLSAFWLGVILIIPRLWDAVSDPIIGHLSDNARTRFGRRRPFILLGGILVGVFFVVMWWVPKGEMIRIWFPSEAGFQAFQLVYILISLLLFFTACTIFEIPHGALGMEMTSDYHERTKLFSAKSFVGNLFAMSTPWLFALANMEVFRGPGGNEADGMRYVSLMVAGLLIPLSIWWFFSLREPGFKRVSAQAKTPFWSDMKHTFGNRNFILLTLTIFTLAMGFNFVNLLGSYIPIFYVFGGDKVAGAYLLGINGTVWAVTGLLAVFPLNWISPKIGKRKTLMIAIALMVVAQLSKIVCYNPKYPYLIIIPTLLLSAGMLFFFTLGSSMVGDICDEDDLNTGHRTEGSFYSIFWWFIKMGTALASFVAGSLIVFTQFDQTQVTKVDALEGSVREMRVEWENLEENEESTVNFFSLVDKAIDRTSDLKTHLEERELEKRKDNEHHEVLTGHLEDLENHLEQMKPGASKEALGKELDAVEQLIVPLKRQSPFTLLMMRVVEIGLPIMLSIFSIFFITRYALTEKRSHEIKELLRIRNRDRDIAEATA